MCLLLGPREKWATDSILQQNLVAWIRVYFSLILMTKCLGLSGDPMVWSSRASNIMPENGDVNCLRIWSYFHVCPLVILKAHWHSARVSKFGLLISFNNPSQLPSYGVMLQHRITLYKLQGGLKHMLPIASLQPWWVWPPLIATPPSWIVAETLLLYLVV